MEKWKKQSRRNRYMTYNAIDRAVTERRENETNERKKIEKILRQEN